METQESRVGGFGPEGGMASQAYLISLMDGLEAVYMLPASLILSLSLYSFIQIVLNSRHGGTSTGCRVP